MVARCFVQGMREAARRGGHHAANLSLQQSSRSADARAPDTLTNRVRSPLFTQIS